MKIFLCSTSFDLEDLRALAVEKFQGKYEFIHFEDAAFPSRRGLHSHDQCIEAVRQADVVISIIDRRYGGKYKGANPTEFPDQTVSVNGTISGKKEEVIVKIPTGDLSITWCELLTAYHEGKYVITFARRRTMDEKATRRKNQGVVDFKPAHVDDVLVFDFLDWITKRPKDNWIIPFDTAVDFLAKLERWLEVADATMVVPPTVEARESKPITIIVEGQVDAEVAKVIAQKHVQNHPVSLVVAHGKRPLLGNLKVYASAFKESSGVVILADADTTNEAEIETQKIQFQQIIKESDRPDARLVFAVPEIEVWLARTNFKRDRIRDFNKLHEELYFLQEELEKRRESIPSLAEFIAVLEDLDGR